MTKAQHTPGPWHVAADLLEQHKDELQRLEELLLFLGKSMHLVDDDSISDWHTQIQIMIDEKKEIIAKAEGK